MGEIAKTVVGAVLSGAAILGSIASPHTGSESGQPSPAESIPAAVEALVKAGKDEDEK